MLLLEFRVGSWRWLLQHGDPIEGASQESATEHIACDAEGAVTGGFIEEYLVAIAKQNISI